MNLTQEIKSYAKKIGIDELKITTADDFPELNKFLVEMKEKGYLSKFVKGDFDLITDPKRVLKEAKTVIVCAISYKIDDKYIKESKIKAKTQLRGKLSRFAWGKDYHCVVGDKLNRLVEFIKEKKNNLKAKTFVDTGPTVDRVLARRAGIGWQGKNCSIINPEYGSWIFIGGIITNLNLEINSPLEERCGHCTKCIDICPTGALKAPYTLDSNKCLGHITLSKGYIDEEYRKKMGDRLWGCDSCQEVCPHNKEAKSGNHQDFFPQILDAYPKLEPLITLSKREYKEKFGPTPMNWRGKRPIQRNAAIIMGNLKDKKSIPYLMKALTDPKPIVRAHSAWALAEIGDKSIINELQKFLDKEKDEKVKEEMELAIN